jgi:hypothetical protein
VDLRGQALLDGELFASGVYSMGTAHPTGAIVDQIKEVVCDG